MRKWRFRRIRPLKRVREGRFGSILARGGERIVRQPSGNDWMTKVSGESKNTLYCSFCGKSQHEVRKLIAGPTVFICDECVELCMDIIREESKSNLVKSRDGVPTPSEIRKGARRLRHRPGQGQEGAVGGCPQPLQAPQPRDEEQRRRAGQVEHHADRPDRFGQDAAGPDSRPHHRRAVHDVRRDDPDRSRLRRRGRREHHPEASAGRRLQCRACPARHRLHRRGRQDQPQVRQSVDHPRRVGRGRAAGAPEDHGRHGGLRSAAGRTQASAAGVPAGGYHQHPVHLRRRLRRPGKDHLGARQVDLHRLPGAGDGPPRIGVPASCSPRWSRKTS